MRVWIILLSVFLTVISGQFSNLGAQIEPIANGKNIASSEEGCGPQQSFGDEEEKWKEKMSIS